MTGDAADKLARSRLAIIEHVQRRGRRGERPQAAREPRPGAAGGPRPQADGPYDEYDPYEPGAGRLDWMGRAQRAAETWWRHHPGHMALELVTPVLQSYASRHPVRLVAGAAAVGALLVVARPWRLISVTTVLVAVLKSSQLSSVLMSALSAADFARDVPPHEQE